MKHFRFLFVLVFLSSCGSKEKPLSAAEKVKEKYQKEILLFKTSVENFLGKVENNSTSTEIKEAFFKARLSYKRIEFLAEFYNPVTAKSINGPALDEVEEDDPLRQQLPPEGFQVIEELIFPEYDSTHQKELLQEVMLLRSNVGRLIKVTATTDFSDGHIFEAIRLEIVRIIALGISGFDSPIANHSLPETGAALSSINDCLKFYGNEKKDHLNSQLIAAQQVLRENNDFNGFDRFSFISQHLNPIAKEIFRLRAELKIEPIKNLTAFSSGAATIFQSDAFDINFFAPEKEGHLTVPKAELGKLLFFDPILSGNNKRSCASCHNPDKAFTDGIDKSLAFNFKGKVNRNAPTVLNAGLQSALFHDSRVMFLEDQATDVVGNVLEMHGDLSAAAEKIKLSEEYVSMFRKAFPEKAEPVSEKTVKIALASFTRSLTTFNSPFDLHIRGDRKVLKQNEISGFNLFMGKAKCGTCHFTPLFNGAVPPTFENTEAEVIGVPATTDTISPAIDGDVGKYNLHKIEKHRFAFKTPTLRNVALTAPYMHNGIFNSLEEVIEFYNRGGGRGLGIDLPNQTLPEDRLKLSKTEKEDLISFMHTLTDTAGLVQRPAALPRFSTSNLNKRKVGGVY